MAKLSQIDREHIGNLPLDGCLDHMRVPLQKALAAAAPTSHNGTEFKVPGGPRKLVSATEQLLAVLRNHEAAAEIRSTSESLDISDELQKITVRIWRNFNQEDFSSLIVLVIGEASDIEIWTAVLELISHRSQVTPPRSIQPSFDGTLVIRSSSSFQGKEQTKRHLDAALLYELANNTFRNVEGFFEKFFEQRPWSKRFQEIYQEIRVRRAKESWLEFPDPPEQNKVLAWLTRLQDEFFPDAPRAYYTTESSSDMTGGEAARQLDIFLKSKNIKTAKHDWKDVDVIGEHKQSRHGLKELLLQLTRYIRDAFHHQPTRRFVHGFFLHGSKMELWVFDRSGPYSSGEFDVHEEPEKFLRAFVGYAFMDEEELGLDTFISDSRGTKRKRTITFDRDVAGKKRRLQLEPEPFVAQRAVVCRGTTCFRTTDRKRVVKFSWTSDKRRPEADFLELARKKNVKGLAKLVGYQSITSISELRRGLEFGRPYKFRNSTPMPAMSSQSFMSYNFLQLRMSNFEGQGHERLFSTKSASHGFTSEERTNTNESQKRKSQDQSPLSSKRSRINGSDAGKDDLLNAGGSSSSEPNNHKYDNRNLGALAIEPCGRSVDEFKTIPELLTGIRDAIRAHRSLLLDGEILHRDISVNNMILTDPTTCDGFNGMLIDVELGKLLGSGKTGARYQTGTVQFMAIGVLRREAHTYRHDIESFFYVLLWIFGRLVWEKKILCDPKNRPAGVVFQKWYRDSFEEIAQSKQGDMHADGFKYILSHFPTEFDCVKPLCSRLRRILFPLTNDGELDLGTPADPNGLYERVLEEFDTTITTLPSKQQL